MEEQRKFNNMTDLKMTKLCYPKVETWFICWEDTRSEIKAYGSIEPTQCLETPFVEVDYYIDEAEWAKILIENGVNPYPEPSELAFDHKLIDEQL